MRLLMSLFVVTGFATPAHAQSSASGSLAILAQLVCPLSVAVTHPLDFGRLLTSTAKTIAPSDASSGHLRLIGQGGSAVTVTLTMPSQLSPTGGGTNLPITGWSYVVSNSAALGGTPVSFNTGTSDPISLRFDTVAGSTNMYLGIGATITTSASSAAVAYTATGQIIAAYTDL
ncbi:MAG: hypothetical protein ABI026_05445 [Gemmatimonadaceae bacterium]